MSYYDDIYEIAVDNHYLVTSGQAAEAGVPNIELVKLAHRGRLERVSQGLYRLARNVPSPSDAYAVAVAQVGENAYLYGGGPCLLSWGLPRLTPPMCASPLLPACAASSTKRFAW